VTQSIHRLAAADLADATRFYKAEAGAGLARRFLAEFERVAELLERHPGLGTPSGDGRQSHPLTDFPYSVIYRASAGELRILVLRHQSRNPDFGSDRR
jgi:plasmid stabilization system protein ParE